MRKVEEEKNAVTPGQSSAKSSKQALFYHDIAPEFYRRVALRHTVGHKKHNDDPVPITMNLNWRVGLNDPLYVMDRLNHMFEHFVCFLESGNKYDDNLAAIGWCVQFLMEVERMHPEVLQLVLGQCHYSGETAETMRSNLQDLLSTPIPPDTTPAPVQGRLMRKVAIKKTGKNYNQDEKAAFAVLKETK